MVRISWSKEGTDIYLSPVKIINNMLIRSIIVSAVLFVIRFTVMRMVFSLFLFLLVPLTTSATLWSIPSITLFIGRTISFLFISTFRPLSSVLVFLVLLMLLMLFMFFFLLFLGTMVSVNFFFFLPISLPINFSFFWLLNAHSFLDFDFIALIIILTLTNG